MPQESWPVNQSLEPSKAKAEEERKKVVQSNVAIVKDTVIDPSRYSKWSKLLRVTAYVLLFIIKTYALAKIKKQQSVAKEPKAGKVALTAEDLINSEYFWYQRIQEATYPDEFEHSRNGEPILKNSRILKLDPFFEFFM